jgi:hypothetical protein
MATLPVPQVHIFKDTDKNGLIWNYPKQEFKFSCGAACLRYVKQLVHNELLTEKKARKLISQFERINPISGTDKGNVLQAAMAKVPQQQDQVKQVMKALEVVLTPTDTKASRKQRGAGLVQKGFEGDPSWNVTGTRPELVVVALHADPLPVPEARLVENNYYNHLMKTTPDRPAILAVMWMVHHEGRAANDADREAALEGQKSLGGHFILCTGPTRDQTQFIILDPMSGIRYLDRSHVTSTVILYDSGRTGRGWETGSIGKVDSGMQKPAEPTKVDTSLVSYVAKGHLSLCGVIVTHNHTI